jgi:hypothetical protein
MERSGIKTLTGNSLGKSNTHPAWRCDVLCPFGHSCGGGCGVRAVFDGRRHDLQLEGNGFGPRALLFLFPDPRELGARGNSIVESLHELRHTNDTRIPVFAVLSAIMGAFLIANDNGEKLGTGQK